MESIGVKIRSKIPVIQMFRSDNDKKNEETYLLDSISSPKSNKPYSADLFSVENTTNSTFQHQVDDFIDNDLIEYTGDGVSQHRIDEWQAAWNVTNAIQGMFVVSLPYAVANGGYWALLAMLVVAYICCYTGKILIDCLYDDEDDELVNLFFAIQVSRSKRRNRIRASYVDIAKDVWGSQIGARLVNVAQNIELLMTCILYLVLCGDLFVGSFPTWPLDHTAWTMISCMVLVPCAFIRSLRFVSRLSFYNAVVHLVINLIIVAYCVTRCADWDFGKIEYKIDVWTYPISLGIIVFSYTSQIFLPTLEGSMYERRMFNRMLDLSHVAAAVFKSLFGLIGFLTWQEQTDEVITNNLPTKELKVLVNMILVVKALLSYPLPYFASVELLDSTFFLTSPNPTVVTESSSTPHSPRLHHRQARSNSMHSLSTRPLFPQLTCYHPDGDLKFWAICLRISLILFTLFLAIFIPHFAILMGLIGSITGTMLSLIWPCYFHLRLKRKSMKWYQCAVDITIIVFGLIITVTGVFYSSVALIKALRTGAPTSATIARLDKDYYRNNNFLVPQAFNLTISSKANRRKHNTTAFTSD